jgi:hypothetical protein
MITGGPVAGFKQRYFFLILKSQLKNIFGRVPGTVGHLAKMPGMAFTAGKIATGLIN